MIHYSRKHRQLKNLVKLANRQLKDSNGFIDERINKLKIKIQRLINQLRTVLDNIQLRKTVGALALVLGLTWNNTKAQVFADPVESNCGIGVNVINFELVDIDLDGDLDLFYNHLYANELGGWYQEFYGDSGENIFRVIYQENIGTSVTPQYTELQIIEFILLESTNQNFDYLQTGDFDFADIDNDGDGDLIVGCTGQHYQTSYSEEYYNASFIWFENNGTAFNQGVINPFNIGHVGNELHGYIGFDFVDIDGDGDLDLLFSFATPDNNQINKYYQENTGTQLSPIFNDFIINPFGLQPHYADDIYSSQMQFVDIDQDGDQDLFLTSGEEVLLFYKNEGTSLSPEFSNPESNPFNITSCSENSYLGYMGSPFVFGDIDNDGDKDLFIECLDGLPAEVIFQENISPTGFSSHMYTSNKKLEKVFDALGREVNHTTNQILFHIYDDGSVEKKFIVE